MADEQTRDTVLSDSLRRKLRLKESEVTQLIDQYVSGVKNRLYKNRYCRLDGIGYLMFDNNESLTFKDTFWKRNQFPALTDLSI